MGTDFPPTPSIDARVAMLERKFEQLSQDVIASFRLAAAGQLQTEQKLEQRFNTVDASLARVQADMASMKTEILTAFNQLLTIIDTRLPGPGQGQEES